MTTPIYVGDVVNHNRYPLYGMEVLEPAIDGWLCCSMPQFDRLGRIMPNAPRVPALFHETYLVKVGSAA